MGGLGLASQPMHSTGKVLCSGLNHRGAGGRITTGSFPARVGNSVWQTLTFLSNAVHMAVGQDRGTLV